MIISIDPGAPNCAYAVLDKGVPVWWDYLPNHLDSIQESAEGAINTFLVAYHSLLAYYPAIRITIVERFTYRPGGKGKASEAINIVIGALMAEGRSTRLVTASEWKTYVKRRWLTWHDDLKIKGVRSEHQRDAVGLGWYWWDRYGEVDEVR